MAYRAARCQLPVGHAWQRVRGGRLAVNALLAEPPLEGLRLQARPIALLAARVSVEGVASDPPVACRVEDLILRIIIDHGPLFLNLCEEGRVIVCL